MENLLIKRETTNIKNNLVRIGDLVNYEGPLLSLFEDISTGHLYLFDWVDRDNKSNRWLIYRSKAQDLSDFINGKISHFDLYDKSIQRGLYSTDIEVNNQFNDYKIIELIKAPDAYIPNDESYFETDDCPNLEKIRLRIQKSLSNRKQENEYIFDSVIMSITFFNSNKLYVNSLKEKKTIINKHYNLHISDMPSLQLVENKYIPSGFAIVRNEIKMKKSYAY